jgi:hypothetical protein
MTRTIDVSHVSSSVPLVECGCPELTAIAVPVIKLWKMREFVVAWRRHANLLGVQMKRRARALGKGL